MWSILGKPCEIVVMMLESELTSGWLLNQSKELAPHHTSQKEKKWWASLQVHLALSSSLVFLVGRIPFFLL
jgi:hypothetical protein